MNLPPRNATERALLESGGKLDLELSVDVGELVRNHNVILTGIEYHHAVKMAKYDLSAAQTYLHRHGGQGSGGGSSDTGEHPLRHSGHIRVDAGPTLHYELLPAVTQNELSNLNRLWPELGWTLIVQDDLGTVYPDDSGGSLDSSAEGAASHGTRYFGSDIPRGARSLFLVLRPVDGWIPTTSWVREVVVDLESGSVQQVTRA
jgi:hypothetical protein